MLKVRVVNQFSGRWGQVGLVAKKQWNGEDFWVEVLFGSSIATVARRNLTDYQVRART